MITPKHMRYKRTASWRSIFTIIELLTVVSIISILITLLLPTLQKVKQKTNQVACMNNMKQMGQVLNIYAGDYDGYLPIPYAEGYVEPYWPYRVSAYFDNYELFLCPSQPKNRDRLYFYRNSVTMKWNLTSYYSPSFGANSLILAQRMSKIQIPGKTITLVDSMANNLTSGYGYYLSRWYGEGNTWVSSRHFRGTNILWADSHVDWNLTDKVWAIPDSESRKYWWKQIKN